MYTCCIACHGWLLYNCRVNDIRVRLYYRVLETTPLHTETKPQGTATHIAKASRSWDNVSSEGKMEYSVWCSGQLAPPTRPCPRRGTCIAVGGLIDGSQHLGGELELLGFPYTHAVQHTTHMNKVTWASHDQGSRAIYEQRTELLANLSNVVVEGCLEPLRIYHIILIHSTLKSVPFAPHLLLC